MPDLADSLAYDAVVALSPCRKRAAILLSLVAPVAGCGGGKDPTAADARDVCRGDGTILRPGETFSMNAVLGERTLAKGYVPAPQISGNSFSDSIGGGISQVATMLYNGAFFAGMELIEHHPHSLYIDRYPLGREATISWGGPELIFRNDWSATLRIDARARNTSLRVRLLSLPLGRRVVTRTEPAHSYVAPRTIYIQNRSLAPGTQRVRQSAGSPGFNVTYTRRVFVWSTLRSSETFHVRYQPQNAVIEIGPAGYLRLAD